MRLSSIAVPALILLAAAPRAAAVELRLARFAPPVQVLPARPDAAAVPAVGRVEVGPGGRAELGLPGNGRLRLGESSVLQLHGVDAKPAVRAVLERGAVHASTGPADLRLNAGRLRLRLMESEAWIAVEPDGDTVCLLDGRVEWQAAGLPDAAGPPEPLARRGQCLLLTVDGRRLHLLPDDATLARKLRRTSFAPAP